MKWFNNPKTLEELKKQYKKLAFKHHPDCGGDTEEDMKAINNEYDTLFIRLKDIHTNTNGETYTSTKQTEETPEDFRNIINELMKMSGIITEVCGNWLWLSGNCYPHREKLKEMGFKWASAKKMWYLGESQSNRKNSMSMENIRIKYGSEVYHSEKALCLS